MNRAGYSSYAHGLLRIATGLLFLVPGLVKVTGFPAMPPGQQPLLTLMGIGGAIELVAGALIMLGLLTRPAALVAAGLTAVSYWLVHAGGGPYPASAGAVASVLFFFIFLFLAAAGPGALGLDGTRRRGWR